MGHTVGSAARFAARETECMLIPISVEPGFFRVRRYRGERHQRWRAKCRNRSASDVGFRAPACTRRVSVSPFPSGRAQIPSGAVANAVLMKIRFDEHDAALLSRVALRLSQAGLAPWIEPATQWAARFSGTEAWVDEPALAPARCVLRLSAGLRRAACRPSDQAVAAALARLPFTRLHARWPAWAAADGRGERWDPLVEPFSRFSARHCVDELLVWEGTVPSVPPQSAQRFLLLALSHSEAR